MRASLRSTDMNTNRTLPLPTTCAATLRDPVSRPRYATRSKPMRATMCAAACFALLTYHVAWL